MDIRKSCALAAGALFLTVGGIAATTGPVAAAPNTGTHLTVSADYPTPAFRKGFRNGFADGFKQARRDCQRMVSSYGYSDRGGESHYMRGYSEGFERGFAKGFDEYCY